MCVFLWFQFMLQESDCSNVLLWFNCKAHTHVVLNFGGHFLAKSQVNVGIYLILLVSPTSCRFRYCEAPHQSHVFPVPWSHSVASLCSNSRWSSGAFFGFFVFFGLFLREWLCCRDWRTECNWNQSTGSRRCKVLSVMLERKFFGSHVWHRYRYVWSAILYSHLTESDVYLVTAEERSCCGKGCKYQAISSCFGWWGLFGIFYTLYALIFNCTAHVDRTNFTLARLRKRQAATHAPSAVTAPLRVEGEREPLLQADAVQIQAVWHCQWG